MYRQMSPYVSQIKKNPARYFLSALTMDLLRNCLHFHVLFSLVHTFLITSKVLIKLQLLKAGLEQFKKIENDIVSIIKEVTHITLDGVHGYLDSKYDSCVVNKQYHCSVRAPFVNECSKNH